MHPLIALMALAAAHTVAGDLIGKIVPPYPHGLKEQSGGCMEGIPGKSHPCDFMVDILADSKDRPLYVVAGKSAGMNGNHGLERITDVVLYPTSRKGYGMQDAACRVDGVNDGNVIAYVRDDDKPILKSVAWARRLDVASGKFVVLDPKRVDCDLVGED